MNTIGVDDIIATVQSSGKTITSHDKLIFRQWIAVLCLPVLGLAEEDVKTVALLPINGTVPKPDDVRCVIDISLFDVNGCPLAHKFRRGGQRIYRDDRILPAALVTPPDNTAQALSGLIPVDVSEDAYSIFLGTNADRVTTILLRYYAAALDDGGYPLIRTDESMAILLFLHYMIAMRDNENQSEIQAKEIRWKQEADRVKAHKKSMSVTNEVMKYITNSVWMRGIPNFNFSQY